MNIGTKPVIAFLTLLTVHTSGSVVRGPINRIDLALGNFEFVGILLRSSSCLHGCEHRRIDLGRFSENGSGGFTAFSGYRGTAFSSASTLISSVSRLSGDLQPCFHVFNLPPHISSLLPHRTPLQIHQQNKTGGKYEIQDAGDNTPPIGRRIGLVVCAAALLALCCRNGSRRIDNGRTVSGRLLLILGFGVFWCSLVLVFLSGFEWSWSWLL